MKIFFHNFLTTVSVAPVLYFPWFIYSHRENLVKANAYENLQLHFLKIRNAYQLRGHENDEMILAVWFDDVSCTNSLLMRKQLATTQTVMIWDWFRFSEDVVLTHFRVLFAWGDRGC